MSGANERIALQSANAFAEIAVTGAEPVSWRVDGRELLWMRDPVWWDRVAPILFPSVGASRGGHILVAGKPFPMPLHGFAKDTAFRLMERGADFVRLRMADTPASRACFPFAFRLDVTVALSGCALELGFDILNCGEGCLPYALGFHPGFRWSGGRGLLEFEAEEEPRIPCIAPGGLISHDSRALPMHGRILPLGPDSFKNSALVFRNARSREVTFIEEHGAIRLRAEGFRHLAAWSRPCGPFLCLEVWTSHADREDFCGEFAQRDNMIILKPGRSSHHRILLEFLPDSTLAQRYGNKLRGMEA